MTNSSSPPNSDGGVSSNSLSSSVDKNESQIDSEWTLPPNHSNHPSTPPQPPSLRTTIGQGAIHLSDFVNNHLAEVRTATTVGIGLLAVYGISQTPLFFRYRTVQELPAHVFRHRTIVRGRLVRVWVDRTQHNNSGSNNIPQSASSSATTTKNNTTTTDTWRDKLFAFPENEDESTTNNADHDNWEQTTDASSSSSSSSSIIATAPIFCAIRHASPVEAWLSQTWYNRLLQWQQIIMTTTTTTFHMDSTSHTPRHGNSTAQQQRPDEQTDQLLIVRLAGVQSLYQEQVNKQNQQQHAATRTSSSPSLLASMDAGKVHGHGSSTSSHGKNHHHDYGTTDHSNGNDTMMLPPELEWLQLLADERPLVSCQLLARQVPHHAPSSPASASSPSSNINSNKNINKKNRAKNNQHLFMGDTSSSSSLSSPHKRPIPGMEQQSRQRLFSEEEHQPHDTTRSDYSGSSSSSFLSKDDEDDVPPQMAIGRLYYRPSSSSFWNGLKDWIFPTDVAASLVQMGRASVASDGLLISSSSSTYYRIEDTTESVRDLQRDVQYMEGLQAAEYQAVAEQRGVWQLPAFRNVRADVVKEVEFQTTAPWYQKVWRWMRGG